MDNSAQRPSYQQVKAMIKQFTGQANTLVIPRVFIDFTGDHLAALLLSQILYWSDKTDNADGWFYKTADEWQAEIGMSAYQVKRAATTLAQFGVVTAVHKVAKTPKMHYRIDMQIFTDLFIKFLESEETSKSRNYAVENQETSKSMESEETSKSYKEHRLPETTDREGDASKRTTPASVVYLQPAVVSYTNLTGRTPNRTTAEMIAEQVTNVPKWEREINRWLASDFKPGNVVGMLDWYHGKGRHQNGSTPANRSPADLPLVSAAADKKQIATPEERKRIIEARMTGK